MNEINSKDIQEHYKVVLQNKKQKLQDGHKIKVAFFISQKQLWCGQSVYNELKKNKIFDPVIVVFPNRENSIESNIKTCQDNYDFFKQMEMNVVYGYDMKNDCFFEYKDIQADIVFFDQPYPRLPEDLRWPIIYKDTLVCYIPYGYKVANFYEAHFNMDLQNSCWAIFAESSWHKEQFASYGPHNGSNVVVSGYPKLDEYIEEASNKNSIWKISKESSLNDVKKVIWAPHWSINHEINYSTFDKYYRFFLELAIANKNISWIFKPHQRLKHHIVESGFMLQDEVDDYYDKWNNLENGYYYNDSNYFNIFKTSDALITDCGSFLAEYLPTKKPIIHLKNEKSQGYNEIGNNLINSYYKVYNINDLESFISEVIINGNDYLLTNRLSVLPLVQPNFNGAGKYIVEHICKQVV